MTNSPNRRTTLAGAGALAAFASTKGFAMSDAEKETLAAAFDLDALSTENAKTDGPWLQFFDNNTMFSGIYEIPAGGEDRQSPHQYDALYFVAKGKAVLIAGDERFDAGPGGIYFVKARIPHRFVEITEDLQVLVFFSKADPQG